MLYIFLIALVLLLKNFTLGVNTGDLSWHEMKPKNRFRPSGRFDALTWVDDQNQLWLYGGKTVIRINGTEFKKHLHDMWTFNPMSYQWTRIALAHKNESRQPQIDKSLFCFCHGGAFVFGHQIHKKRETPELWVYNISSNVWNLIDLHNNLTTIEDCFAMWCNNDSDSLSVLCYGNKTAIKLWIFKIKSGKLQTITNQTKFTNAIGRIISKSSRFSMWNGPNDALFVYVWSYSNLQKNSKLLSINHDKITLTQVNNTKLEYFSNRRGFMRWIDSCGNLHLLGGKISNFTTNSSGIHWVLNKSDYSWSTVNSKNLQPSRRTGAGFWQIGGHLWLFGGHTKDSKGRMVILNDFWIGNMTTSKPVISRPTPVNHQLPGDTLGLSLVNKLIISMVTLFVVMAISVRLCYKRELNLLISRLGKNRVLYHELSQEGDKSTRL